MKKLVLFAFLGSITYLASCKKEEELKLNPPDWIKGVWVDSIENANGVDNKYFINFTDDNIKVYTQYATYSDYNNIYKVQSQIEESTGYYLRLTLNSSSALYEETFVLMPYGSMVRLNNSSVDRVYVRP